MPNRGSIKRSVTAALSRGFLSLTRHLPLSVCRAMGTVLGTLAYACVPRIRRVGMQNLDRAYGDTISRREKKRILLGATRNTAIVAAEFSHLAALTAAQLCDRVELKGRDILDAHPGSVILSAHFGNWEWLAPVLSAYGYPLAEVVRPLDDPALNAAVDSVRRAQGVETIDKDAAGSRIFELMREGVHVGILVDQSPRVGGVPVTFFGVPCWSTVAPAMLALRSKAPMVFASITREPGGGRYSYNVYPPVEIPRSGDLLTDLVAISQACQDRLETMVRERPDHWLWLHRRWKPRPRLEAEWQERMARKKPKSGEQAAG